MSALRNKFVQDVNFSEEVGAFHVRVAGQLLTNENKDELFAEYQRVTLVAVNGWRVVVDGVASVIVPVNTPEEMAEGDFSSFSQAKKALVAYLQDNTDLYREACKKARTTKKLDTLAASMATDDAKDEKAAETDG